jgi:DNA-binding transcriptional MerR regulator
MFKIADFSRLTRVTVKMLRHYDEIGLLRPHLVDPASGYRYYSADQLPRLNRIIALKDLGFSLEQVAALLDERLPLDALRGMLRLRRAELEERMAADRLRLSQIEERLREIGQEEAPPLFDVVVRPVAPLLVAAIRATVPHMGRPIAEIFDTLEAYVAQRRARSAEAPPLMLLHDAEYREQDLDVEVAVPLTTPILPAPPVQVYELPGAAAMACAVYTGDYARTAEALQAILRAAAAAGQSVAGPIREVYLRFGADSAERLGLPRAFLADAPALFVTEVQVPVG